MLIFQGVGRTNGALNVIALPAGAAPPAGSVITGGIARLNGYLYVVIS